MFRSLLTVVAAAAMIAGQANAAVVIEYTTAASTDNATLTASIIDANVTADLLETGGGLTANNGSTWNWRGWDTASVSFADAVAAGDFWTWGFDVATSATIEPTTLDIRLDRSGSGPDDFEIQASVNGAPGITLLTHDYDDSGSGVTFDGVDISAIGPLTSGDSVVFTMAAFNSESAAGTFDLETVTFPGGTDSISVNATITAIPEPSALAILAIGGCSAALRRRNRR